MASYCLGVSISHNGSAVLLRDGELCAGIEKERLTRVKHDGGDETLAVRYCLDAAGITMADVDLVVQNWLRPNVKGFHRLAPRYAGGEAGMFFGADLRALYREARRDVVQLSHHHAHAWSAYGASPFDEAAVLVMDQCGNERGHATDWDPGSPDDPDHFHREVISTYHARGDDLRALAKVFSPVGWFAYGHALRFLNLGVGSLYAGVTRYCFDIFEDESGKVMALAPYGRGRPDGDALPVFRDGEVLMRPDFEWTRRFENPMDFEHHRAEYESLCASAQAALERVVLAQARALRAATGSKNLCFAGGLALNCVANKRLLDETGFERIFVQPAAHDGGIAIGCAKYGWHRVLGEARRVPMRHAWLGRAHGSDAIDRALARHPLLTSRRAEDAAGEAARRVAEGQLVGWFQGGCEFGPRALGNRSVLADPRRSDVPELLNRRVKRRPDFQPYAPSVLADRCAEFFELDQPSPYMLLAARVRDDKRAVIPAVVHVDGSSRVQTVDASHRPYHDLLTAFAALTGVPVVVNTSMNVKGEPIVESPAEALDFFITSGLDVIFLGDRVVERAEVTLDAVGPLRPTLTPGTRLITEAQADGKLTWTAVPQRSFRRSVGLTQPAHALVASLDASLTTREVIEAARPRNPFVRARFDVWAAHLLGHLWRERLIDFNP
jgi:carbamoyltransferase